MRIVLWNRGSEDLWGLRSVEVVGAPLASLDIGLPLTDINPLIGRILVEPGTVENTAVDAVNRRGKQVRIRVTCSAFGYNGNSASGALLAMDVNA